MMVWSSAEWPLMRILWTKTQPRLNRLSLRKVQANWQMLANQSKLYRISSFRQSQLGVSSQSWRASWKSISMILSSWKCTCKPWAFSTTTNWESNWQVRLSIERMKRHSKIFLICIKIKFTRFLEKSSWWIWNTISSNGKSMICWTILKASKTQMVSLTHSMPQSIWRPWLHSLSI